MATKNIDARFRVKKDTAANWEKHNPILLDGEQIFVITAAGENSGLPVHSVTRKGKKAV